MKPITTVLPKVLPQLLKKTTALHFVKLRDMSEGDVCVVFSREGNEPLVVVKHKLYLSVALERVVKAAMDWYSRLKIEELRPDFNSRERPIGVELVVRNS